MENEVLRDILLVITVLAVFVFGFFVMKRLDKFFNENYKPIIRENEEKPTRIVHNEDASDEEILSTIKKVRERVGKNKEVISNEDDSCEKICYNKNVKNKRR